MMADADKVVLIVPSRGEFARTVRMTAAELASRAGMDLDGIDDSRMAAEEAFIFAAGRAAGGDLTFTFIVEPGSVELTVDVAGSGLSEPAEPDRDELLTRLVLESICDEFELRGTDGAHTLRLVKRAG
jgi:serine/threonine-protein kinase RsbW